MSYARYWLLHELRRVRASERISRSCGAGTQSSSNATKERRYLQRELVKLRAGRKL